MKYFGWIFLFFIMLYILPLNNRPVLTGTENCHRQITCEMMCGNRTVPVYQGELQRDRMPMANWLTLASFKLFGVNRFASRLPATLAIGITALLTALIIQQTLRDEKLAALAATICMSFSLGLFLSNSLPETAIFTMFVSGASGALFLATQEERFNRRKFLILVLSGIFTALAFLTGGSYALIFPLAAIILFLIVEHRTEELLFTIPVYLISAILPVIPWAIAVSGMVPGYWQEFFSFSGFRMSLGSGAPYYAYFAAMVLGCFPVIILLPTVIMAGKEAWGRLIRQPLCRFAMTALISSLMLLTLLRNAPAGMIFVAFPALSLLIAMGIQAYFNNGGHHRSFNWMLNVWGLFLLLTGILETVCWFMRDSLIQEYAASLPITRLFLINLGITSIIGGGIILYSLRGNWRSRLYLYFFSVAILPLAISWCFTGDTLIRDNYLRRIFCHAETAESITDQQ